MTELLAGIQEAFQDGCKKGYEEGYRKGLIDGRHEGYKEATLTILKGFPPKKESK